MAAAALAVAACPMLHLSSSCVLLHTHTQTHTEHRQWQLRFCRRFWWRLQAGSACYPLCSTRCWPKFLPNWINFSHFRFTIFLSSFFYAALATACCCCCCCCNFSPHLIYLALYTSQTTCDISKGSMYNIVPYQVFIPVVLFSVSSYVSARV